MKRIEAAPFCACRKYLPLVLGNPFSTRSPGPSLGRCTIAASSRRGNPRSPGPRPRRRWRIRRRWVWFLCGRLNSAPLVSKSATQISPTPFPSHHRGRWGLKQRLNCSPPPFSILDWRIPAWIMYRPCCGWVLMNFCGQYCRRTEQSAAQYQAEGWARRAIQLDGAILSRALNLQAKTPNTANQKAHNER